MCLPAARSSGVESAFRSNRRKTGLHQGVNLPPTEMMQSDTITLVLSATIQCVSEPRRRRRASASCRTDRWKPIETEESEMVLNDTSGYGRRVSTPPHNNLQDRIIMRPTDQLAMLMRRWWHGQVELNETGIGSWISSFVGNAMAMGKQSVVVSLLSGSVRWRGASKTDRWLNCGHLMVCCGQLVPSATRRSSVYSMSEDWSHNTAQTATGLDSHDSRAGNFSPADMNEHWTGMFNMHTMSSNKVGIL